MVDTIKVAKIVARIKNLKGKPMSVPKGDIIGGAPGSANQDDAGDDGLEFEETPSLEGNSEIISGTGDGPELT